MNNVKVTGNVRTSDIDVLGALGLDGSTSLVGISAKAAQKAIASLPWVAGADVLKIYPDTLSVVIHERKPFAVWQHDGQLSVIDSKGRIIVPFQTGSVDSKLPVVVGQGAATIGGGVRRRRAVASGIADRVKDYIRVGDRRWDLELKNGVTVKLPQDGADHAMDEVLALDGRNGLLLARHHHRRHAARRSRRRPPHSGCLERRNADMKALMKSRRRSIMSILGQGAPIEPFARFAPRPVHYRARRRFKQDLLRHRPAEAARGKRKRCRGARIASR